MLNSYLFDQGACAENMPGPQRGSARTSKKNTRRRRANQSGNHVVINTWIIASSQTASDLPRLLHILSEQLGHMNVVNLTTGLHRIGKLVGHDPKAQAQLRQSQVLPEMLSEIAAVFSKSTPNDIQPQTVSNVLWALATIRHVDAEVISLACQLATSILPRFKSFELSSMLWAIAKLGTLDGSIPFNAKPVSLVFEEAVNIVLGRASSMEFRALSMIAWAFATAKQSTYDLFACMAVHMTRQAGVATCQEMGNTVWAFGTLNVADTELFAALGRRAIMCLNDFKPQELSNMLWGFASSGFFDEDFFQQAAIAAQSKDLSPQHLANILWAFSRVRPTHALTQHTLLSFLPVCLRQMCFFKPQELSSIALSVAKAFAVAYDPCQRGVLPGDVMNFFASLPAALPHDMADFSTQSLTNMANAFALVGLTDTDSLFWGLGREAVSRAHAVSASELLRLFQAFLPRPGTDASVAASLAVILADRLQRLQARDARALSRSLVEYFGLQRSRDLKRHELRELCLQVAQGSPCSGYGVATLSAKGLDMDNASVASTEEPGSEIISQTTETAAELPQEFDDASSPFLEHLRQSFFKTGEHRDCVAPAPGPQLLAAPRPRGQQLPPPPPRGCPSRFAPDSGVTASVPFEQATNEASAPLDFAASDAPRSPYMQAWLDETIHRVQLQSDMRMARVREDFKRQHGVCVPPEHAATEIHGGPAASPHVQTWIDETMQRVQAQSHMRIAQIREDFIDRQHGVNRGAWQFQTPTPSENSNGDFLMEGMKLMAGSNNPCSGNDTDRCAQWGESAQSIATDFTSTIIERGHGRLPAVNEHEAVHVSDDHGYSTDDGF